MPVSSLQNGCIFFFTLGWGLEKQRGPIDCSICWSGGTNSITLYLFLCWFEILSLQETSNPPALQGYHAIAVPAVKTFIKGQRRPGSIHIHLFVTLNVDVQIFERGSQGRIQVVLIQGQYIGSLFCINICIPPKLLKLQSMGNFLGSFRHHS